jgi:hypothetical protein
MDAPSPRLLTLVSAALKTGIEITLNELADLLCLKGLMLDQLVSIQQFLDSWQLEYSPPITTGDFGTARVLRSKQKPLHNSETIFSEIRNGESSRIEFKASFLYDHKRAHKMSGVSTKELRSDEVIFSTLKTVAAFLNCGGGILFIGIDDEASKVGLHYDCEVLGCKAFDADKWQLEFRNHITGKFKDGATLNDYVNVSFVQTSDVYIARIEINGRRRLAFLYSGATRKLYRRQGNRTVEVLIDEVEEFIEMRKEYGWI